jgi:hypothetical protein
MIAGCGAPPAPVAQDASPPKELAAKFSEVIAASPDAIARALVEDWQCTRVEIVSADHLKVRHTGSWSEFANERPVEVALITDVRLAKVADGTQVSFETLPDFTPAFEASRVVVRTDRLRFEGKKVLRQMQERRRTKPEPAADGTPVTALCQTK